MAASGDAAVSRRTDPIPAPPIFMPRAENF